MTVIESRAPSVGRAWLHVGLAFLFMLVNYADKAVIGLSSVPIMRELGLSSTQFGELGSAFFLLFSLSGVAGGMLADRVNTKTLMGGMAVLWGVALLPVSLASSFTLLLVSRVVLGAAEGPAFPVALHSVYKWFSDRRRALPTSIVACGAAFGTGVVAPLVSCVISRFGWHAAFGALAAAGLAWTCVWFLLAQEGPVDAAPVAHEVAVRHVPYARLLGSRTAIGVFVGGFAAYWVIAVNITWLANYLIRGLRLAPTDAAWIIGLPSLLQLILAPGLALLSQRLMRRGVSSRVGRGVLGALCVAAAGASMICMTFVQFGILKVLLIGVAFSIGSVIFTLGSTLIGEISPPAQRGTLLGTTNSIHTLAGLFAPVAMGGIVDAGATPLAGFDRGFRWAGALVMGLGVLASILIRPEADLRRFRRYDSSVE